MAILSHEHLFEQAEQLIRNGGRWPKQVDVRRAVSAAYYGLFHFLCSQVANQTVGRREGSSNEPHVLYCVAYRGIDHRQVIEACKAVKLQRLARRVEPSQRVEPAAHSLRFSPTMIEFADNVQNLQRERHQADYDPSMMFSASEGRLVIESARETVALFKGDDVEQQKAFVTLLLFKPRQTGSS